MSDVTAKPAAPLDEVMLAMDVVDTLRHRQDLADARTRHRCQGSAADRQAARDLSPAGHRGARPHPQGGCGGAAGKPLRLRSAQRRASARRWRGSMSAASSWGKPVLARCWRAAGRWASAISASGSPIRTARPSRRGSSWPKACRRRWTRSTRPFSKKPRCSRPWCRPRPCARAARPLPPKATAPAPRQAVADLTALRDQLRQEYTLRVVNRSDEQSGLLDLPRDQYRGHQLLHRGRGARRGRQRAEPAHPQRGERGDRGGRHLGRARARGGLSTAWSPTSTTTASSRTTRSAGSRTVSSRSNTMCRFSAAQ